MPVICGAMRCSRVLVRYCLVVLCPPDSYRIAVSRANQIRQAAYPPRACQHLCKRRNYPSRLLREVGLWVVFEAGGGLTACPIRLVEFTFCGCGGSRSGPAVVSMLAAFSLVVAVAVGIPAVVPSNPRSLQ
jgi:hypothetical protein